MKKSFKLWIIAASSILMAVAGCNPKPGEEPVPDVDLKVQAVIGTTPGTRVNSEEAEGKSWSDGDIINIAFGENSYLYSYGGQKWSPVKNDEKIIWTKNDSEMAYSGYYPGSQGTFALPSDQSTTVLLSAADYMVTENKVLESKPADETIVLNFKRKNTKLIIIPEEFEGEVSDLRICSPYSQYEANSAKAPSVEITPYKSGNSYMGVIMNGGISHSDFNFIKLNTAGGEKSLAGLPALSPGYSYTITIVPDPTSAGGIAIKSVELGEWGKTAPVQNPGGFEGIVSLTAPEVVSYDEDKALAITSLSIQGDLTEDVTAAIFGKFKNVEWLELTDFAGTIPDNFMYDPDSPRTPTLSKIRVFRAPNATAIGENAFRNTVIAANNNSSIRSVYFPKVTKIGVRAFSDLWTLEEAVFPELTEVGESAFSLNKALKKVDMPKLTFAPNSLFYSCTAITEINMPELVEAGSAFYYCGGLTSISLPKLKIAGESCFSYSTKLTEINIPNVETLGKMAMYACNGLLSFKGDKVTSVGDQCFQRCYVLGEVTFPIATTFGAGCFIDCETLTKVNIPACTAISDKMFYIEQNKVCFSTLKTIDLSKVESIGVSAFEGCKELEDVDLSKVVTVGNRAFYECVKMKNTNLSNLTTTGEYAFFRCWGFTGELNLPKMTAPGKYCFRECKNITKVTAPLLVDMSLYMFADCTSLAEVDMPVLKKVENFSFLKCAFTKVDMPTVETMINGAFSGCANITTVNLPNVKSVGSMFTDCPLIKTISLPKLETLTGGAFSGMTGLETYDVPLLATLEVVPSALFQNCKSLTKIELPQAKELGMSAIRGCDALESIELPNVVTVGNFVFADNPKLKEVKLPLATAIGTNVFLNDKAIEALELPSATSFGIKAFSGCTGLKTLKLGSPAAITMAATTFDSADVPAGCDLSLNAAGVEYGALAPGAILWKDFTWKSISSYTPSN